MKTIYSKLAAELKMRRSHSKAISEELDIALENNATLLTVLTYETKKNALLAMQRKELIAAFQMQKAKTTSAKQSISEINKEVFQLEASK